MSRPLSLTILLFFCAAAASYVLWLPDVAALKKKNPSTTAYIELRRTQARTAGRSFSPRWTWVGWDDISEHLKHAVLIAEDDAFYRHGGIDWDAVRIALDRDIQERRFAYGASTITQQVARNLYLSPSKNPLRKIKEVLIARRLEKALGKRRIFELYLNIAEWGKGIFGAEAAAQAYFGKHASELGVDEAVALAVVLPSPRRHDPARGGPYVDRNSRRVLARMRASGFLPDEDEEESAVEASTDTVAISSSADQGNAELDGRLGPQERSRQSQPQDGGQQQLHDGAVLHSEQEPGPLSHTTDGHDQIEDAARSKGPVSE